MKTLLSMDPATMAKVGQLRKQGKAVVERCQECNACQEWLLTPSQAPVCPHLLVMFPDGEIETFGTERKAFRAIEAWFLLDAETGSFNGVGTIEWRHGTCAAPRLRKSRGGDR